MAERPEAVRADANGHLTTLGACLPRVASCFTRSGALGVVVVDAAALGSIEVAYGGEALHRVTDELGGLVADVAADHLGIDDLVVVSRIYERILESVLVPASSAPGA